MLNVNDVGDIKYLTLNIGSQVYVDERAVAFLDPSICIESSQSGHFAVQRNVLYDAQNLIRLYAKNTTSGIGLVSFNNGEFLTINNNNSQIIRTGHIVVCDTKTKLSTKMRIHESKDMFGKYGYSLLEVSSGDFFILSASSEVTEIKLSENQGLRIRPSLFLSCSKTCNIDSEKIKENSGFNNGFGDDSCIEDFLLIIEGPGTLYIQSKPSYE